MPIDKDTALSIINEYKSGFEPEFEMPATDEQIIEKGEYLYQEAKKSFDQGDRHNTIQSIIFIGDSATVGEGSTTTKPNEVSKTYPRRSSGGLSESDEREIENLPIPHEIEGDPDPMPRDFTNTNDREIRRLSGEYNAYLNRVNYLLGVETADLQAAEHLLRAAEAKALRELKITDPETKKPKLAKVMDAEIAAVPEVAEWVEKVNKHKQRSTMLKTLKEIYSGNVDRLSREWTMRQNEWEKGR